MVLSSNSLLFLLIKNQSKNYTRISMVSCVFPLDKKFLVVRANTPETRRNFNYMLLQLVIQVMIKRK